MTITVMPASVQTSTRCQKAESTQGESDVRGDVFSQLFGLQLEIVDDRNPQKREDEDADVLDTVTSSSFDHDKALPLTLGVVTQDTGRLPVLVTEAMDGVDGNPLKQWQADALLGAADQQLLPTIDARATPMSPLLHRVPSGHEQGSVPYLGGERVTTMVTVPMHEPSWSKAMGTQLLAMVSANADKAYIEVNPRELGPIEVSLQLNDKCAQITFNVVNPMTRDMLENHLPKLSEMLLTHGIELADAQFTDARQQEQHTFNAPSFVQRAMVDEVDGECDTLAMVQAARGVLSIFV